MPEDLTEEALEQKLFPPLVSLRAPAKALPDFDYIYRELKAHKKLNLTLDLLWREYKEQHPKGFQYTQFCVLYRHWRPKARLCMRQDHRGGEKLFVGSGDLGRRNSVNCFAYPGRAFCEEFRSANS